MRILHILSTALFWLGYPFVLVFKFLLSRASFFFTSFSKSLSKVSFPRKIDFPILSHIKVPCRSEILGFVSHLQWNRIQRLEKIDNLFTQKISRDISLFEYSWTDVWIHTKFVKNLQFELQWWWEHGAWRTQLLPKPSTPYAVSALASFHFPFWMKLVSGCLILISVSGYFFYQELLVDLPSASSIRNHTPKMTTKIYDRDGNLLYKIFKDENRTYVALDEVSPHLVQATLAIEDDQFYEHWGISLRGIGRAFWHNIQNETTQGGSTITQQLIKNTLLTPERTWKRKIRELVLAVAVDAQFTKQEILELYLNEVNYGGSIYGVEEASQWYFGKSARDLTLAESALLAGLPVAPTTYNPFGSQPERAFWRQQEVLQRMLDVGLITQEQLDQAKQETIAFRAGQYDIISPHFVMYIRELLVSAYGEDMVNQGGLEVYTTLDPQLQASAEASVVQELARLERLSVSNGASLVTDPNSGEILAMVGSKDYFDVEHDGQVNVVFRSRQPGSSIKPVTYALAFEQGFTPQSTIEDVPVVYTSAGSPPYAPRNYDGQFYGRVTLRDALANSRNIPAVRLLAELGVSHFAEFGTRLGISTWGDTSRHGLAMTLGSNEVTMYDMAQVYGVFANGGERVALNPIVGVYDHTGRQLYRNPCVDAVRPCNGERVLSASSAYLLTSVLSDNQARARAFGLNSDLYIPGQEVAVKTGTTNSLRDNWTIGYTNDTVVLSWVGNNDNTPMSAVASGVTGASPIWNEIMTEAISGSSHQFALPVGLEKVKICASTGTLPCAACPQVVEAVLPVEQVPQTACQSEWFADGKFVEEKRTARL